MTGDPVEQVLRHRLRSHRAALKNARELGSPPELAEQVAATEIRIDELRAVIIDLDAEAFLAAGWEVIPPVPDGETNEG